MAECCSGGIRMLYACSGAADVGQLSDMVARKLRDENFAKMSCLAAIGADLSGYIETARAADVCFSIDGCATACARKNLERVGVAPKSYVLTDMGCEKGSTMPSESIAERIARVIRNDDDAAPDSPGGGTGCSCGC